MTIHSLFKWLCTAGIALYPSVAFAQDAPRQEDQPLTGSCVVALGVDTYKREACELSTGSKEVPAGFRLIVEDVSAACSTTPFRGIYTLALQIKAKQDGPPRLVHIPVRLQTATRDQVRMTGAALVRYYAGPTTTLDLLVSTTDGALSGHTTCDVTFSGVLRPVAQ